jgi:hypothetical protein
VPKLDHGPTQTKLGSLGKKPKAQTHGQAQAGHDRTLTPLLNPNRPRHVLPLLIAVSACNVTP